jgi:hypothetical protein
MRRHFMVMLVSLVIAAGSIFVAFPLFHPVQAQPDSVIQSQETDSAGVIADLIQCKRKKGVLTIKVRIKNTSPETVRVYWSDAHKHIYLIDEQNQKKYYILKDAEGQYIFSGNPWDIMPNAAKISWFKFPAPSAEVEEITFILPGCTPFEDIPISD